MKLNNHSAWPLMIVTVMLCVRTPSTRGYEVVNHHDIGQKARALYIAFVAANVDSAVGVDAISHTPYWNRVYSALEDEDGGIACYLCYSHFWNPDTGTGILFDPPVQNALERAQMLWQEALAHYEAGQYDEAYEDLGRVMHLAADMGTPAHVHCDMHPGHDWYEWTYILSTTLNANAIDTTSTNLSTLFTRVAEVADDFDSGPENGGHEQVWIPDPEGEGGQWVEVDYGEDGEVDCGTRRSNGFTAQEGSAIAQACYPAAISAAGGVLRLFYQTIKPQVFILSPTQGEIRNTIPFSAIAVSYNATGGNSRIEKVEFYYQIADTPVAGYAPTGGYTKQGIITTPDPTTHTYRYTWSSLLNERKVWLRARSWDLGHCDSLPESTFVSVDNTPPVVINKKP